MIRFRISSFAAGLLVTTEVLAQSGVPFEPCYGCGVIAMIVISLLLGP